MQVSFAAIHVKGLRVLVDVQAVCMHVQGKEGSDSRGQWPVIVNKSLEGGELHRLLKSQHRVRGESGVGLRCSRGSSIATPNTA